MTAIAGDVGALRAEIDAARRELAALRERFNEVNRAGVRQAGELTRLDDAFRRSEAAVIDLERRAVGSAPALPANPTADHLESSIRGLTAQVESLGRQVSSLQAAVGTIAGSRAWRTIDRLGRWLRRGR